MNNNNNEKYIYNNSSFEECILTNIFYSGPQYRPPTRLNFPCFLSLKLLNNSWKVLKMLLENQNENQN